MYETSSSSTRPREDLMGAFSPMNPLNAGFIADKVLPPFRVSKENGVYAVVPREAYLQQVSTKRAPRAPRATSEWTPGQDTWSLVRYGFKSAAYADDISIYGSMFNVEEIEARRVAHKIAMDREIDVATAVFNTTTFANTSLNRITLSSGAEWDVAAGVPATNVATAKTMIVENYGVEPNTLIMSYYTYARLGFCTQIRDYLGDNADQPGMLPIPTLQGIFGLPNILVASGLYATSKAGATLATSRIWSNDMAMVCRVEQTEDISLPQLGRTLRLNGQDPTVESYEINDPKGSMICADDIAGIKLMNTPIGVLISNTAA